MLWLGVDVCLVSCFYHKEHNFSIRWTNLAERSSEGIVPHEGPSLSALDHDFHFAGITPSVVFISSIPPPVDDTFFSGNVCVITKDKSI